MYQNFLICINAVIPLLIYLLIGIGIRRAGLITEEEVHRFNHLVFVMLFPPLMFENLYAADIGDAFDGRLELFAVIFVFAEVALAIPIVSKIEKTPESRGAMIQGIYRSNFVLMGLPIAINVFGKGNTAVTAALIMVIVPLYNVLAVIILEYYRGGGHSSAGSMVKKVLTNPIIVGALAALAVKAVHLEVPGTIEKVISSLSDATTPMALILLGAQFTMKSVSSKKKDLAVVVIARLIIVPAVGLSIAMAIGIRGVEFVSLLVMLAAPAAVSSFTMAESMGSDGKLAGNIVVFTTAFSCLTIFIWLFIFKNLGAF